MNKTYCDFCGKEIEHSEAYQLKITSVAHSMENKNNNYFPDLCLECIEAIYRIKRYVG